MSPWIWLSSSPSDRGTAAMADRPRPYSQPLLPLRAGVNWLGRYGNLRRLRLSTEMLLARKRALGLGELPT